MPFGLKGVPATFQNVMRHVLAEQWGVFVFAYLDDIIIYSRDWEEHLVHISLVLERLDIYGLTVSPTKCHFGRTSLPYLGHWISADGNSAQSEHIEAIRTATFPRTRRERKIFPGGNALSLQRAGMS